MLRSKEYTLKTKQLSAECKIKEDWKRKMTMTAVYLILKNNVYDISDQPGCSNLKISLINDGWNLNFPRTIKVRYSKERNIIHPMFGLSGTVYEVSDVEYEFARDVIKTWNDMQSIVLGATYEVEGYNTALLMLSDRKKFWNEELQEKAKIVATLCQVLNTPLVQLVYELENGMSIIS